jgi:tetratricopeptide (TPR) repeat protein
LAATTRRTRIATNARDIIAALSWKPAVIAGIARDGLTRLTGESLIGVKRVACPEPAAKARALANSLYGAQRYAEAAVEYEKAAAACPNDAAAWVDFADSYYVMDDFQKARVLFLTALSVDPWNREAPRFLSDTEVQLRNLDGAVHHLALSVVSDPIYEAGWSALRAYAAAVGFRFS